MPTPIAMPKLGMTMREGTVVEWCIPVGARITKGQTVLVIESEKAEVEIAAPSTGVLRHVYVESGTSVPCGSLLAVLTESDDVAFDPEAFLRANPHAGPPVQPAAGPSGPAARGGPFLPGGKASFAVTPAARRRARELEIDLARVSGSGPGGRVTREDVEAVAARLAARVRVAEGVFLEVQAHGEGEAVLLLPGFGADVTSFARQIPALVGQHRVLALNPRGVGLSDAPEAERYDVPTAAADAARLADGPAHVIGASLGAAVALELALERPERVRSLTLITPFVRAGPRLLAVSEAWCKLAAEASPETLALALVPWLFSSSLLADAGRRAGAVRALAQTAACMPAKTLERAAAGLRAWSGRREGDLGRLGPPTLVIGAREDLLTPGAEALAAAMPGAACVVVAGAGHAVGIEAAEAVNQAILAHLGGLEPGAVPRRGDGTSTPGSPPQGGLSDPRI